MTTAPWGVGPNGVPNPPPQLKEPAGIRPDPSGAKRGPGDKFRNKKPDDYDDAEWDQLIDEINEKYNSGTSDMYGPKAQQSREIERWVLEDVVAEGKRTNTLKTSKRDIARKNAATEVAGSAREQTNAEKARLLQADQERENANLRDESSLKDFRTAGQAASKGYHDVAGKQRADADLANKNTRDTLANLGKNFEDLNKQDQNSLADYLSKTDPMMAEIFARTSDPADIQRQLDAYTEQKGVVDKYKSLSDPEVTAKERYMSELARREFEAGDKSSREAVSEGLANRGLRSGGQQIAGQQQSTQQLSQDRLLKELGIQGQAVDRSMKAMEGWSSASAGLGAAAGAIRSANDSQRQYEDNFKQQEAERRAGLAGERKTASDTTTGNVGARQKDFATTSMDAEGDIYGRNTDSNKVDWDVADKDYGLAGDYRGQTVDTIGRRTGRADTALGQQRDVGQSAHDRLIGALGIQVDEMTDAEEREMGR